MPLSTLAPTVSSTGISSPAFTDILASLQASFQTIYGADVYLGNDTQDGQLLAIFAKAIFDSNQVAVAVYNQFNPSFAVGVGLSNLVRINGIARLIASNSQVDLLIGGTVGTIITNGIAADANGNLWALPASVTIPVGGQITATATCTEVGSIAANVGTVTLINTPVLGWSTATNTSAASLGASVEDDATLRLRQAQSVSLPALTVLAATVAAVEAITGVTEVAAYENDTGDVDSNGLPAHSISLVVNGGDATAIATAIMIKKTPGCFTYGSTVLPIVDSVGVTHNIAFYVPTNYPIKIALTIKALAGYTSATGTAIKQSLVDYINNTLRIGQPVFISRLYLPAQFDGAGPYAQYELQTLLIAASPGTPGSADVPIPFNAQATCQLSDVALTVV